MDTIMVDVETTQFSECGLYRWTLRRDFLTGTKKVAFVMLNPSVAGVRVDDPTTRRAVGFSQRLDCRWYLAVNLHAFRSTDPVELLTAHDPIGQLNDEYLMAAAEWADEMIVAWGAGGKYGARAKAAYSARTKAVIKLLSHRRLWCLGLTKHGFPCFPLYLAKDTQFEKFTDHDGHDRDD